MSSNLSRKSWRNKDGTTLVMLAVFIVALFAFAALSIDVANVFHHQRNEQAATDAGAFAAIALLTNSIPATTADIIQEAQIITVANGVTTNEITVSNYGTIQVGHWDGMNFVDAATPRNAVLVPAKRNVPLVFGKVIGMNAMNPATHSIAALEATGCITDSVPFLVALPQLAGKMFGDSMTLNQDVGSGNWGKIDINNYQTPNAWLHDMVPGGCGCQTCVGIYPTIPGDAMVKNAFQDLPLGSIFSIPIGDNVTYGGNSGRATVVGFVEVQLTSYSGQGSGWSATVQFLSPIPSGPGGGSCPPPCIQTRTLVQ